jgi:L-alanine-DL-glutamate epimerase-like enolase superfamily enzyme
MSVLARVETFTFRCPIERSRADVVRDDDGERAGVFVRVEDADGGHGWGRSWCNFPAAAAEHRAQLVDTVIAPRLLGRDVRDPAALWHETERGCISCGCSRATRGRSRRRRRGSTWRCMTWRRDGRGSRFGRRWAGMIQGPCPSTASGMNPARRPATVAASRARGYRAFKVKLGFGRDADLATMRAVAATIGEGERLMIDINQGWTMPEACRMAAALADFDLDWIEEPIAADRPRTSWVAVAAAARAPLAGDLRGLGVFQAAIEEGPLSVIQPDAAKWGGATANLPVGRAAVAAARRYCPHFLGGAVGLMHSLHLIAAVRGPGRLEVDVNANPLRETLLGDAFPVADGAVSLPGGTGLGWDPDLAALDDFGTMHTERIA